MSQRLLAVALFALCAVVGTARAGSVVNTVHNLSASGPGTVKAASESEVCIFCHTPHGASPAAPLWNRAASGAVYQPYSSSTSKAAAGQPTGSSVLCLSCHDGTIALGSVLSRAAPVTMGGGVTTMPVGASRLGTNLTHDHPISFAYTSTLASQRGELATPATLQPKLRLDAGSALQCTTCHDAHDNTNGAFLAIPNTASAMCIECHKKPNWSLTSHSTSNATWNGTAPDPFPAHAGATVASNACESCHLPHASAGGARLLAFDLEERNCSACHSGNVAPKDVMSAFAQVSIHPIAATWGVHDPLEPAVSATRHVECVDCHDAHSARANANPLQGALLNVRGVDIGGNAVATLGNSYELCFRCHGDSSGQPAPTITRQIAQSNTRLEFQTSNPSFHPVAGVGRSAEVPSLIAPLSVTSTITCTSCHTSNVAPSAGGAGAEGPHGSAYAPLLARRYDTADNSTESAAAYAACYACHDRTNLMSNASFRLHKEHVQDFNAPCAACHDAHGISSTQGNATNNAHLINFNSAIVRPNSAGLMRYRSLGRFTGACDLQCHGQQHTNFTY
jgi:predicted CXXCH cytochrome family protein